MPGAYAHITLVNLAKETTRLEKVDGFPPKAIAALNRYFKFCELGTVSPDYPYLDVMNDAAKQWADLMHYRRSGDTVKRGVEMVQRMANIEQQKAFSWLAGFAAHVTTDVTIHPVVELKVGPYAQNKTAHRICEMHQDAYIFQRLNLGQVGLSEHLKSGIWACCSAPDSGILDPTVTSLWSSMLESSHAEEFTRNNPDMNHWHRKFKVMVDDIGEEGYHLIPLARHVAVNCGLTYPAANELDNQYLRGLATPDGAMDYDAIFDKALNNVVFVWQAIAAAVFGKDERYKTVIANWNLDTGKDEQGNFGFWRKTA